MTSFSPSISTSRPVERADEPHARLDEEWLLTNGLGGFAMGTPSGVNTRRYHGLLIGSLAPPVRRILALHSVAEELSLDGERFDVWSQGFGDEPALHPDGWRHIEAFHFDPDHELVGWVYRLGAARVTKLVRLTQGENRVAIGYRLEGVDGPARLTIRPLTPLRSFHGLSEASEPAPSVELDGEALLIRRDEAILRVTASDGDWALDPQWWYDFAYTAERARGLPWHESLWSPGQLCLSVPPGGGPVGVWLEATLIDQERPAPATFAPLDAIALPAPSAPPRPPRERLAIAARQFVVTRRRGEDAWSTIIAGYPWFADWGRDSMISLPGLLLESGRLEEARSVLHTFARHVHHGLVPNRFADDGGTPEYNSVDASLWFVHGVRQLLERDDWPDVGELLAACRSIVEAFRDGTDFGIHQTDDGLIAAGDPSTQLTWMDAKRDGITFTPRHGKAVEINALWYNALLALSEMTADRRDQDQLEAQAETVKHAFREAFWWPQQECCHDVLMPVDGGWAPDSTLRPNQIFAVSLPRSPLTKEQQQGVVAAVKAHLLTPAGLRTLSPEDPAYKGRYEGDLMQRDAAYHQGTVWPWLLGPFAEAWLRVNDFSAEAKAEVREMIQPLLEDLDRGGLGQVAEVYDGDSPQRPSGCPAQAWSVAELLRILNMIEPVRD